MDEMSMRQPHCALELNVNDVMQYSFKHLDDVDKTVTMEWHTGTVKKVSDGSNLRNASGSAPKFYKNGDDVDIEWYTDEDKGEEISCSIAEIKKILLNCYEESALRLFFDTQCNKNCYSQNVMLKILTRMRTEVEIIKDLNTVYMLSFIIVFG